MCRKVLIHPSHQKVKSCNILIEQNTNQSELFQSGHGPRPDLHTALEPGGEILQDLNQAKFQPITTVSTRS